MSELAKIKRKIAHTEAKIRKAEDEGKSETYLISLKTTLSEHLNTNYILLLANQGKLESSDHQSQNSKLAALRDAILCGSVNEENEVIKAEGVTFPVESKTSVIFVRDFYDTFYNHFRSVIMHKDTEPGVIFNGSPGMGKSHMAMFFLYKLLRDGVTVVYEKVLANKVYVFPPTGECREHTGDAHDEVVPELKSPTTVHLFDACAGVNAREPFLHPAKLAIFASSNETSYKQLLRSGVASLTVPSYSRAELDKRRVYFPDVTDDEYEQKIEMFGCGSIRLVLGLDQAKAVDILARAIENTTVRDVLDIVQHKEVDTAKRVIGPHVLFTVSLAEGVDKSNISSYSRLAASWNVASPSIMSELIRKNKDEAMLVAERAATVFQDTPGLEATAGMFFQSVAPLILAKGGTFRVRELSDDGQCEEYDLQWPTLNNVYRRNISTVSEVFNECTDGNTQYCFPEKMAGFDAYRPPNAYFNFTVGADHTISIEAAVDMCEWVNKNDKGDKVHLYFVVPADRFDAGWTSTQSFVRFGMQSNLKKLVDPESTTRNKSLKKLNVNDEQVSLVAKNLVQYALRIPTWNGASVRRFSTMTSASRSGVNGMTAQVVQRVWKFIV